MNRKSKRSRLTLGSPEGLESRSLLTAGLAGGLNLLMDLGEVSRTVATHGVELSASIPAHSSITFQFETEAAGNYLLQVRHVGDGLTLVAKGPSGAASINPGPAGPLETLKLPLKAAEYDITASAVGDKPVLVDWELLLTSGVSQSAAIGPAVVAPSGAVPPSSVPGPVALSAFTSGTPSTSPSTSTLTAATSWAPAVAPSVVSASPLIGRAQPNEPISPIGPSSSNGLVALAYVGDGLPAGVLRALSPVATGVGALASDDTMESPTSLLALDVLGNSGHDLEAIGSSTWLDRVADFQALTTTTGLVESGDQTDRRSDAAGGRVAVDSGEQAEDAEVNGKSRMIGSPGLILSGIVLASALHRWRPGFHCTKGSYFSLRSRRTLPKWTSIRPQSMA